MKLNFNFIVALFGAGLFAAACGVPPRRAVAAAPVPEADGGAAQRLVALVDYVGGDYRLAVRDGAVVAPDEYGEQRRFAAEIRARAAELLPDASADDPLLRKLAEIEALVQAMADAEQVARACGEAHALTVARFGLETRPLRQPSRERGAALFAESCAGCHGARGDAETERARTLVPPPASFRNPERLRDLSPYRVYNALTFGVPGTAMAAFEALTPSERWDLAFYVFSLGHDGREAQGPVDLSLPELASRSDRELLAAISAAGGRVAPATQLAFARLQAPYLEPTSAAGIAQTRELLGRALARLHAGEALEADGLLLDAYLQGFEPVEPRLRARDAGATAAVETGFRDVRAALARSDLAGARDEGLRLDGLLARLAGERGQRSLPFVAATLIYLREGLEAALLVGALLAGTARLGRPQAARFVHAGWLLALPAGIATWWVSTRLMELGTQRRELVEAVVALLAAAVLFSVSFWMISKAESKRWAAYLRERLERGLSRRSLVVLSGIAFLAVYREAAETVLFTQALLLEADSRSAEVWAGAAAGLAFVAILAFAMNRTVLRLPIAPFFAVSSLLLLGLAVSFAGSGIYGLVGAGYLRPRPVAFPEVSWLGIHPDLTGLLVQLTIVGAVALAGLHTLRRRPLLASRYRVRRELR